MKGNKVSSTDLIQTLNQGGWVVSGGHYVRDIGLPWNFPVVKVSLDGEVLSIETKDRIFVEVPSSDIVVIDSWIFEIRYTFMRKQQRKKIDGGGWYEVSAVGVALKITNPTLEEAIRKDREERAQRHDEARRFREEEVRNAARKRFVDKLTNEFVGKKIVKIDVVGVDLHIKLEDGSKLSVQLDGGDTYDAWINVNNISLDDFSNCSS